MIKRTTIETIEEYDANGKLTKKTTTETHEEDESVFTSYPSNVPQPNPYWPPSITWDTTGNPPPIRYDQVTCNDFASTAAKPDPSIVACNMPDDCASCDAGCRQ